MLFENTKKALRVLGLRQFPRNQAMIAEVAASHGVAALVAVDSRNATLIYMGVPFRRRRELLYTFVTECTGQQLVLFNL